MAQNVTHYQEHVGTRADKFYKTTLFQAQHLMIGLNCLEPGQIQANHTHDDQDKFYMVLEGTGHFTVANEVTEAGPGHVVWAEAGVLHGVENKGSQRLVVLVGIAPAP
ncbi:MAG TPA: cupin domain-containing protein [Anaerolineae bacterium]|nr:cupin domain-containing protein [Anaerolineae bacterium]HMR66408.1 cupin domain-containing protein [Anaerolineae bacterium]